MEGSPRPPSPSRSIRSDVVRSFTTSSETSASERIAATRAARALRRAAREADDSSEMENFEAGPSHATLAPVGAQLETPEGTGTGREAISSSSPGVPRLRVQPTSDRSYSPSVPSSPAKSKKSTSASSYPSSTASAIDLVNEDLRSAGTGSAAFSAPSTPPPRSPSPSPPSSISLAGGLMERLKAQRAARAAHTSAATDASDSSPAQPSMAFASPRLNEAHDVDPPAPSAVSQKSAIPSDDSGPSSFRNNDLDSPPSSLFARPSTIYDRDGGDIEFDFHQLSDVPEQTERSSLSTWQAGQRTSWATSATPASLDSRLVRSKPLILSKAASPSRNDASSISLEARRPLSSQSDRPDLFAQSANPPRAAAASPYADSLADGPIRRLDATAHLTGRSASSASIFSTKSHSSSATNTSDGPASILDHGLISEGSRSGRSSPIRRLSPEVARRAAVFGSVAAPSAPSAVGRPEQGPSHDARVRPVPQSDPFLASPKPLRTFSALSHSSDEDLREATPAPPTNSGISLFSRSSLARAPPPPAKQALLAGEADSAIRCEGHLLVFDEAPASPRRLYCVLTDAGLESRPTDQIPDVERTTVLRLTDCVCVEFEPAVSDDLLRFRPFAIVLCDGGSRLFAADAPVDRVRWITAFRHLLSEPSPSVARAESARSLTPPGSFFSETRGTVRSWPRGAPRPVEPVRSTTTRRADRALVESSLPERASGAGIGASPASTPPPLPPKPLRPRPVTPIRPSSTDRPLSLRDISSGGDIAGELRELLAQLEVADLRKRGRHERYKRLRERLAALRGELDTSTDASTSARDADLAAKVDYLLAANERLLRNQELLQQSLGERASALEANERELVRRVEDRLRDLIHSADRTPGLSRSLRSAAEDPDARTVTTRRGGFSRSEQANWAADLRAFQSEAAEAKTASSPLQGLSSVPSPTVVRKHREQASRKLEGLPSSSGLSRMPTASQLFSDEQVLGGSALASPYRDPFAGSGLVEPAQRLPASSLITERPDRAPTVLSFASSDVSRLERTLSQILHSFEKQDGSLALQRAHQERVSQVVGELARRIAEDRSIRDVQFQQLVQAVEAIVQHVAQLPERPAFDSDSVSSPPSRAPSFLSQASHDFAAAEEILPETPRAVAGPSKQSKGGLLNPNSSFAQAAQRESARKETSNPRGPRMPAFRLWGAPDPTAERTARWGRPLPQKPTVDEDGEEAAGSAVPAVAEALTSDEQLEQSLQAIAREAEGDLDPAAISMAVLEILSTMRDIARKQDAFEAKETAEKMRNNGLTDREAAELEVKRAEIARIEARTLMSEERTARINEMVAKLAERTEKADQLLKEIAQNVQEGKKTQLDPALSEEVKQLLGGVRAGVDDHVKDFRGQLTTEIQRMFKEVGKLREEKIALQSDIAELLAFQAKHGGPSLSNSAAAPPSDVSIPPSLRPGMPTSGFFGPRAPG